MRNVTKLKFLTGLLILSACNVPTQNTTSSSAQSTPIATSTSVVAANGDINFTRYVYIALNGQISEYGIDPEDHTLVNLETQSYGRQGGARIVSPAGNYWNLVIHPTGKWMYATMYDDNTTGMLKINDNGTLSHIGTGIGPSCIRPESITFNSAGNLMYVKCNAGGPSGRGIISMTINPSTGALGSPIQVANAASMAGFISTNNLTFPDAQTSVDDGSWTYAFVQGSLPLGIFFEGALVTYTYDAFIGRSIAITQPKL